MSVTALPAPESLEALRKTLTAGHEKIVRSVMAAAERELIDSLPELQDGVNTAAAEGSFSLTLTIKKAKRGRFAGKLTCRVRTPREPTEFDFHVAEDGQLSLGVPDGWDE
jgi:hypothetical protein